LTTASPHRPPSVGTKMIEGYGAPVGDQAANAIAKYRMTE
jgi:hypothetical protein